MRSICPLCNGLYDIDYNCTNCGATMVDEGPRVNLMDDYSPYLLDEITNRVDGVERDECIHIFRCPSCGIQESFSIERKGF
ncbi:MAG: hypothetical protein GX329_05675 [Tissierellia bacterium]|nr:hypothetical protein [Tissierellia bacterium]